MMILRQESPYEWSESAARYRDKRTGRFVAFSTVEAWSDESILATQSKEVVTAASETANEDPQGWYDVMRREIKDEYNRQYLAGIGGRHMMTQSDWGIVGSMISEQYRYLEAFMQKVIEGVLSIGTIAARARMYINSAKEAFFRASTKAHGKAGYGEKLWELGTTEMHCDDCPELAAIGWVGMDYKYMVGKREAWPGNGVTECLTNCDCKLTYRR